MNLGNNYGPKTFLIAAPELIKSMRINNFYVPLTHEKELDSSLEASKSCKCQIASVSSGFATGPNRDCSCTLIVLLTATFI